MTEQPERSVRYRIGHSATAKGILQPDATIEATGHTAQEFWELCDQFIVEVEKRYPVQKEG